MKKIIVVFLFVLVNHAASFAQLYPFYDTSYFLPAVRLSELRAKGLEEISGMAASINNPGFLWVHNDSGNDAQVFLLDDSLQIRSIYKLSGIINRDWEDIAVGPGPNPHKNYIYVADIGDNLGLFPVKIIYRFEEPMLTTKSDKEIIIKDITPIRFQLPGVIKDSEALLIDPKTKNLYVVSKREWPVYVYELQYPYPASDTLTAKEVASLRLAQIVGGSFSSDGMGILLKNYKRVFYWHNPAGKPIAELLKEEPKIIPYEEEPQGEAISWAFDGSGFYTLSETHPKKKSYLYFYKRRNTVK